MNGQRALIYSRIRENRLDPAETDLDRSRRQQQVIQATAGKVTSFGTALKLPFNGGSIVKPLATDLSAGQVMQLGWAYFRAGQAARAPLPARRRAGQRRRPVGHLRLRGQRRHDRDVHRPLGTAAAAEGPSLRAGLRRRRPQACEPALSLRRRPSCRPSRSPSRVSFLSPPESLFSLGAAAVAVLRRALAPPAAVVGRVEAGALVMHRDREQHLLDRARAADLAASRPERRSSSGRARTGGRSGNGTRRSASGGQSTSEDAARTPMTQTAEASPDSRPLVAVGARVRAGARALDRGRRDRRSRQRGSCCTS